MTALPTDPERPLVDVRDMIVVHTAMLREFRLMPAAVSRTEPGDRKRVTIVDRHLAFLCDLLHHHHQGEDDLLWPKLRDRIPTSALEVVEQIEAQHEGIDASLTRVGELRTDWVQQPDIAHRTRLAAELERLYGLLGEHLDCEERSLLPLAASVLSKAEWDAVGEAGAAGMAKPDLALAFGMFGYEGDPVIVTQMLQAAPPVPRTILPLIAPRLYARRARAVHGTPRP